MVELRCQVTYAGDYVRPQFNCSTEPRMQLIPSGVVTNTSTRGGLTVVTAYQLQHVQVSSGVNSGRAICSVYLVSNDSQHKVLYTSSWTSAAISVTSMLYSFFVSLQMGGSKYFWGLTA